jgi:hypothetical protein
MDGFSSEGEEDEEALKTHRERRQRIAAASSPQAPIKQTTPILTPS